MAQHRGDDHAMHALTAEFRGNHMTDVVQTSRGMQADLASEAFEGVRESVRMQKGTVAPIAYQGHGGALVIHRIAPPRSKDRAPFQLGAAVTADALDRQTRQLNTLACSFGL
jgi:hypothetical protein